MITTHLYVYAPLAALIFISAQASDHNLHLATRKAGANSFSVLADSLKCTGVCGGDAVYAQYFKCSTCNGTGKMKEESPDDPASNSHTAESASGGHQMIMGGAIKRPRSALLQPEIWTVNSANGPVELTYQERLIRDLCLSFIYCRTEWPVRDNLFRPVIDNMSSFSEWLQWDRFVKTAKYDPLETVAPLAHNFGPYPISDDCKTAHEFPDKPTQGSSVRTEWIHSSAQAFGTLNYMGVWNRARIGLIVRHKNTDKCLGRILDARQDGLPPCPICGGDGITNPSCLIDAIRATLPRGLQDMAKLVDSFLPCYECEGTGTHDMLDGDLPGNNWYYGDGYIFSTEISDAVQDDLAKTQRPICRFCFENGISTPMSDDEWWSMGGAADVTECPNPNCGRPWDPIRKTLTVVLKQLDGLPHLLFEVNGEAQGNPIRIPEDVEVAIAVSMWHIAGATFDLHLRDYTDAYGNNFHALPPIKPIGSCPHWIKAGRTCSTCPDGVAVQGE